MADEVAVTTPVEETTVTTPVTPPTTPTKIFGKYATIEEAEKGYKNLESAHTKASQELSTLKKSGNKLDFGKIFTEDIIKEYLEADFTLSDERYTELAEAGMSKNHADTFLLGHRTSIEKYIGQIADRVGGKETFDALDQWASDNLDADELVLYSDAVNFFDTKKAFFALDSVAARYSKATTKASPGKKLLEGETTSATTPALEFNSNNDIAMAKAKTKYRTDAKYKESVDKSAELYYKTKYSK
jgi:hypothetical protein